MSSLCCPNTTLGLSRWSAEEREIKMLFSTACFFQPKVRVTTMSQLFVFSFSCIEHIPPTQKVAGEEQSDSVCIFFQWRGPRHAFTGNWCNAAAASKTSHQAKKNIPLDNWDRAPLRYHCTGVQNTTRTSALCINRGNETPLPAEFNTFASPGGGWHLQRLSSRRGLLAARFTRFDFYITAAAKTKPEPTSSSGPPPRSQHGGGAARQAQTSFPPPRAPVEEELLLILYFLIGESQACKYYEKR